MNACFGYLMTVLAIFSAGYALFIVVLPDFRPRFVAKIFAISPVAGSKFAELYPMLAWLYWVPNIMLVDCFMFDKNQPSNNKPIKE